jgi:hypothetical protein
MKRRYQVIYSSDIGIEDATLDSADLESSWGLVILPKELGLNATL